MGLPQNRDCRVYLKKRAEGLICIACDRFTPAGSHGPPLFGNLRFFVLAATEAQVDDLIAAGRELLPGNTEFQRFIKDVGNR